MEVTYHINPALTAEEVAALFIASGLRRPVEDLARIEKMLRHANLIIAARDGNDLIGIARALTDFSYCCYLSDLAVDKTYQQQGIGKELIARVRKEIGEESMLLLLSASDAMNYYPKTGFETVDNGFIIKRKR